MKTIQMKNGQLWFNTVTHRVERVLSTGPRVCATSHHKEDLVGWPVSRLRPATSEEVFNYLGEINGRKVIQTTEGRLAYA
jgi:hypothetical protein